MSKEMLGQTLQTFAPSITIALKNRALMSPDRQALGYLQEGESENRSLTYSQLWNNVQILAQELLKQFQPGDRALLLYPSGLDFVEGFFACLTAGLVAVPAYPPKSNQSMTRLQAIIDDAGANLVLTTSNIRDTLIDRLPSGSAAQTNCLATDSLLTNNDFTPISYPLPDLDPDQLAFLQYTSGSTGKPKGVMVSHRNICSNLELLKRTFELNEESVSVTWLPSFHDMGLIDGILTPIYCGLPGYIMPPAAFIQKPIRWLKAISKYGATHSGGPNFAYEHCLQKIDDSEIVDLNLSSWTSAYSGSEPIRASTMQSFAKKFAPTGFQMRSFQGAYGMAEYTLMACVSSLHKSPRLMKISNNELAEDRAVEIAEDSNEKFTTAVGCGSDQPHIKIKIIHPETLQELPEGMVGEIWIAGPSKASGYWNQTELSKRTFYARLNAKTSEADETYLRSGDLGFKSEGEVFVTGRLKDVIIIRGKNYYPQDIECIADRCHPDLKVDACAAFEVHSENGTELALAVEVQRSARRRFDSERAAAAICAAVSREHNINVSHIAFLAPNGILKTSSGKIQRSACAQAYREEKLRTLAFWHTSEQNPKPELNSGSSDVAESERVSENASTADWLDAVRRWTHEALEIPLQRVQPDQTFAELGADSVTGIQFQSLIESQLNIQLDPGFIWDHPTPRQLATFLAKGSPAESNPVLNLESEVQLGHRFPSKAKPERPLSPSSTILLTGATGFLGAFLLSDLIKKSSSRILCLVRCENPAHGLERVCQNLRRYQLWDDYIVNRIECIPGDLSQSRLGLSEQNWARLAVESDVIIHNAAEVNFARSYNALKKVNVDSVRDALQLAVEGKTKRFAQISTIAVFESVWNQGKVVDESCLTPPWSGMRMGYSQSKWVAEQMVFEARRRGTPATVFRCPLISGHSETGAWFLDDFTCRYFQSFIRTGLFPELDFELDLTPVDSVSQAITHFITQDDFSNPCLHLNHPAPWDWMEFGKWIQKAGYPIRFAKYKEYTRAISKSQNQPEDPLYSLMPFFTRKSSVNQLTIPEHYQRPYRPLILCEQTQALLMKANLKYPGLNPDLMGVYFAYFIDNDLVQDPALAKSMQSKVVASS